MEFLAAIVGTLVAGILLGLKESAADAVKSAYGAVKQQLAGRLSTLNALEENPTDEKIKAIVADELKSKRLDSDGELLTAIRALFDVLSSLPQEKLKGAGAVLPDPSVIVIYTPTERFRRYKQSESYKTTGAHINVPLSVPWNQWGLFAFGCVFVLVGLAVITVFSWFGIIHCVVFAGSGAVIAYNSARKIQLYYNNGIIPVPAIVTAKQILPNDSFTGNSVELLTDDNRVQTCFTSSGVYAQIATGAIGLALIGGDGSLHDFIAHRE